MNRGNGTSYEEDLIKGARELQRLATQRRKLRRQLKACDAAIRHARKMLNAIKGASAARRPDVAPMRLHGGATGIVPIPRAVANNEPHVVGTDAPTPENDPIGRFGGAK